MGEMRNAYNVLIGKPEGKSLFGTPKCRREDNIRMDLREVAWKGADRMHLAQDGGHWWASVNASMKLRLL
jgi:hypothetical protein